MERVETGALQINDDWTGLFIRGDDSLSLLFILASALKDELLSLDQIVLCEQLMNTISFDVSHSMQNRDVQKIEVSDEKNSR